MVVTRVDHYENFPVASVLVPARLRPAVVAIYRFARHADDVADEGDLAAAQRVAALRALGDELRGERAPSPIVAQLRPHIDAHGLPLEPFHALLSAFAQDAAATGRALRHADTASVMDYCSRSANPVGELVLRLFDAWNPRTRARSDAICSALQRLNFVQDFAIDWKRGRLYLPLDALRAAALSEDDVAHAVARGRAGDRLAALLGSETRSAAELLVSGRPLAGDVPWRLGLELRAIVAGGLRIAERLRTAGYDPIALRPSLDWRDAPALVRLSLVGAGPAR